MAFEYTKQPYEEELVAVDFSRRVPSGITISAYSVTLEETISLIGQSAEGLGPHIVIGTPSLTGVVSRERILVVMVSAGVDTFKYRLSYRITLSDNQKKEDDVWIIVKET
jgi:hypothetical protein